MRFTKKRWRSVTEAAEFATRGPHPPRLLTATLALTFRGGNRSVRISLARTSMPIQAFVKTMDTFQTRLSHTSVLLMRVALAANATLPARPLRPPHVCARRNGTLLLLAPTVWTRAVARNSRATETPALGAKCPIPGVTTIPIQAGLPFATLLVGIAVIRTRTQMLDLATIAQGGWDTIVTLARA